MNTHILSQKPSGAGLCAGQEDAGMTRLKVSLENGVVNMCSLLYEGSSVQ